MRPEIKWLFGSKEAPEQLALNASSVDRLAASLKMLPPTANGWITFETAAKLFEPVGNFGRLSFLEILAAKCGYKLVVEPSHQRIYFCRIGTRRGSYRSKAR